MSMMTDLIAGGPRTAGFDRGLARAGLWMRIARERRTLADLPDEILRDIGLRYADARREARRPFWDTGARRR